MFARTSLACLALLACLTSEHGSEAVASDWTANMALQADTALGGCAVGDVVPSRPGDEVVCVGKDGSVFVAWHDGKSWKSERVYKGAGELIQVAVGELDTSSPGAEIVAVGMAKGPERDAGPGAAVVVSRKGDAWHGRVVFDSPKLVHGVCVHQGAAYVTGFTKQVHRLRLVAGESKRFASEALVSLPGAGKCAHSTPGGVLIACTDGSLARVEMHGTRPSLAILDRRSSGRARIGSAGSGIVVADNDGVLSLVAHKVTEDAVRWSRTTLHSADAKARGAVLADLEPDFGGLEAATVGYDARVVLLRKVDGEWWSRLIYRAGGPGLHHLGRRQRRRQARARTS